MKKAQLPTQAEIKHLLHYDHDTGVFRWRFANSRRVKSWDVAGNVKNGYLWIGLNKKIYAATRLAWVYMTGTSPKCDVDHINGIRSDNRWENLREATRKQNGENLPLSSANKSGFRGVSWYKSSKKWRSQVKHNGKLIHLGYFDTAEEAAAIAAAKRAELFTHDTGRDKA